MEHRTHIIILGVALVAVIAAIAVTSTFQLVTEPGGYFRIAQRGDQAACFDTDGGANQFVQGAVRYLNWSFVDSCSIIVADVNLSILYEGYCSSSTQPTIVQFNCTRCENGACVR